MSTISKLAAGTIICVVTIALWSLNHGFIAFLNLVISAWLIISIFLDKEFVEKNPSAPIASFWISAVISMLLLMFNHTDPVAEAKEKKAMKEAAEAARIEAMSPEEKKQHEFENTRTKYGFILTAQLTKAAFDPDALKLDGPNYYSNGVCVSANGKNRFGAYVGWQEHCYIYNKKADKWQYRGPK